MLLEGAGIAPITKTHRHEELQATPSIKALPHLRVVILDGDRPRQPAARGREALEHAIQHRDLAPIILVDTLTQLCCTLLKHLASPIGHS